MTRFIVGAALIAPALAPLLLSAQQARLVSGHVLDQDGRPIRGAFVGVRGHSDWRTLSPGSGAFVDPSSAGTFVRSGSDGAYEISIPAGWGPQGDSAFDLVTFAPDFEPALALVDSGHAMETRLTRSQWRAYHLRVLTPTGAPARSVVAQIAVGVGESVVTRVAADSNGRLVVRAPASGLALTLMVATPRYRTVQVAPFQDQDTTTAITVRLLPVILGTVRDSHGHPAPNALIVWNTFSGLDLTAAAWRTWISDSRQGTSTDSAGRFTVAPPMIIAANGKLEHGQQAIEFQNFALEAADSLFTEMWYQAVDHSPRRGSTTIEATVRLRPTREVHVPVWIPARVSPRSGHQVRIVIEPVLRASPQGYLARIAQVTFSDSSEGGSPPALRDAVFRLPAGRYRIRVDRRPDMMDATDSSFDVPVGSGPITVRAQRPRSSSLYAHIGKPAPEISATDLDGHAVRLSDFRGKVVVLDFWGYWCGPCLGAFKRDLIPLANHYAGKPVVVLALHDASVRTRAEFDSMFGGIQQRQFGGEQLPFTIVLDHPQHAPPPGPLEDRLHGEGTTIAKYGIHAFPSLFLIDANGVLVDALTVDSELTQSEVDRLLQERG